MSKSRIGYETIVKYVPEEVVNVKEHFSYLDPLITTLPKEEQLIYTTGPDTIRILRDKDAAEIMGIEAARRALESSGLTPSDIDYIISENAGGKQAMPMMGPYLHHKLGFKLETPVLNIMDACAGFVDASNIAWNLVRSGECKRVLVVVSATQFNGQRVDRTNPIIRIFGDGAAAAIVSSQNLKCEFLSYYTETYGECYESAYMSIRPLSHPELAEKAGVKNKDDLYFSLGNFSGVMVAGTKEFMVGRVAKALQKANLTLADLDMVIAHHMGADSVNWVKGLEEAGVSADKFKNLIKKYGNMAASDLPVDLAEFWEQGQLAKDSIIALWGLGSGLQASTFILRWLV